MASFDRSHMSAILKEQYAKRYMQMAAKQSPFLGLIKTNKGVMKMDVGGLYHVFPIEYSRSSGISATLSNAMANANAPYATAFKVTYSKRYGVEYFDHEFLTTADTDPKAFLVPFSKRVDGLLDSVNTTVAALLPRSHTGSLCQITSISSGVITLSDATVAGLITKGSVLQVAATDGGTPRTAKGYVIATSVSAGTVTVSDTSISGSAADPTSWAANDYILFDGDSNATLYGLADWLPSSAPGATSFFGVDRSVSDHLGGSRYDGSTLTPIETLLKTELLLDRMGSKADTILLSYGTYEAILQDDASKRMILEDFKKVKSPTMNHYYYLQQYKGMKRPLNIIVDENVPKETGYMLQLDTWRWIGDGGRIAQITEDPVSGNWITRSTTENKFEVRSHAYIQLACSAPGWNAHMTFNA